jgi:hypothetical protein
MSISMYDFSIPIFIRGLTSLSAILDKAAAHATAKKFDPAVLAQSRLYPDMHPLVRQVQIACDAVKGAAARLAGVEVPKHEDSETTLADLKQRIEKTLAFLKTITPEQLQGAETRTVAVQLPDRTLTPSGLAYLNGFAVPNFYFHLTIAYALLRQSGVEIGKGDFLGPF